MIVQNSVQTHVNSVTTTHRLSAIWALSVSFNASHCVGLPLRYFVLEGQTQMGFGLGSGPYLSLALRQGVPQMDTSRRSRARGSRRSRYWKVFSWWPARYASYAWYSTSRPGLGAIQLFQLFYLSARPRCFRSSLHSHDLQCPGSTCPTHTLLDLISCRVPSRRPLIATL